MPERADSSDRSLAAKYGLPILTWGLPFHGAAMAVLFGVVGLSASTTRVVAAWKESLVVVLFASVVVRIASGRSGRSGIGWADVWVAGLLALAFCFLVAGAPLFRLPSTTQASLFGFRDLAFFLLMYWVGRGTPGVISDPRTLRRFYAVALVTAAIAVVEWFFVPPEVLALLGVTSYYQDFLGLGAFTEGAYLGLPGNYWTYISGTYVQRAGSVFMNSQGMAVPFVLLVPLATGAMLLRPRVRLRTVLGYGIIWLGFVLTITRMSIVSTFVALLIFILLYRRPMLAASTIVLSLAAFAVALLLIPGLAPFVWETLTWQTHSSASHIEDWTGGLAAFLQQPLGHGLGTADLAAVRAGLEPIAADNLYLKYAVELGILGLVLHLLVLAGILAAGVSVLRQTADRTTRLTAIALIATTVAILLNSLTAALYNSFPLAYLYFWLAGSLVTVSRQQSAEQTAVGTLMPASG